MTLTAAQPPINHIIEAEVLLQGMAVQTPAALAFPACCARDLGSRRAGRPSRSWSLMQQRCSLSCSFHLELQMERPFHPLVSPELPRVTPYLVSSDVKVIAGFP